MQTTTSIGFQNALDDMMVLSAPLDQAGYMKAISERSRHIRNWMMFLR